MSHLLLLSRTRYPESLGCRPAASVDTESAWSLPNKREAETWSGAQGNEGKKGFISFPSLLKTKLPLDGRVGVEGGGRRCGIAQVKPLLTVPASYTDTSLSPGSSVAKSAPC